MEATTAVLSSTSQLLLRREATHKYSVETILQRQSQSQVLRRDHTLRQSLQLTLLVLLQRAFRRLLSLWHKEKTSKT